MSEPTGDVWRDAFYSLRDDLTAKDAEIARLRSALEEKDEALAQEPVAWMWEEKVDPQREAICGKTITRFATHWSTPPAGATPLFARAARVKE